MEQITFYGWGSFENVKRKLKKRYEYTMSVIKELDAAMENETLDTVLQEIWKDYRKQTLIDEMQG